MKKIIWVSSYPKSGNTWIRSLLVNYFYNYTKDFDSLKILNKIDKFPNPEHLKKLIKYNDIETNPFKVADYWISLQKKILEEKNNFVFLKNHNALVSIGGQEFTNELYTLGAIYIVRDPRDVAVSYFNFDKTLTMDKIIDRLVAKDLMCLVTKKNIYDIEILGSWKFNYISWRDGIKNIPKIIIKYEDLLDNTYDVFFDIISYISDLTGQEISHEKIQSSIEKSSFINLQKLEKKGFDEYKKEITFFNSGKASQWKSKLNKNQLDKIYDSFYKEMRELKYI
tara:strand:- start:58 stop:900 length:843 start_codon:yes stop_codon:yes gene_type:complete